MVRLRPPGLGVKGGPQRRVPIATGPPPGYAASAGARSELAMDCPRGLPTFFQYGAGTSGAGPRCRGGTSRVPRSGTRGAAAAPQVPRRHLRCRGGTSGAGGRQLGCRRGTWGRHLRCRRGTSGAAARHLRCRRGTPNLRGRPRASTRVPARAAAGGDGHGCFWQEESHPDGAAGHIGRVRLARCARGGRAAGGPQSAPPQLAMPDRRGGGAREQRRLQHPLDARRRIVPRQEGSPRASCPAVPTQRALRQPSLDELQP